MGRARFSDADLNPLRDIAKDGRLSLGFSSSLRLASGDRRAGRPAEADFFPIPLRSGPGVLAPRRFLAGES